MLRLGDIKTVTTPVEACVIVIHADERRPYAKRSAQAEAESLSTLVDKLSFSFYTIDNRYHSWEIDRLSRFVRRGCVLA